MALMMDGWVIQAGDDVFDVVMGNGMVSKVNEQQKSLTVRFGDQARIYGANGVYSVNPRRTLFWHDWGLPPPPKPMKNIAALRRAFASLAQIFSNVKLEFDE
jgi:hypothetical protein